MMTKFGSAFTQLVSVDSTNNYIAILIEQGRCLDGSVIMADYQTKGRGQRGNSWQSVSLENLLFSLAFRPSYPLDQQIRLSWYGALMWQQCLLRFGIQIQIKWPNDLFVGTQKIGGILIEQHLKGSALEWSVLGCGINVNHSPELLTATSILAATGQRFKPLTVLTEFLDLLNGQQSLLNGNLAFLKSKFEAELFLKDTKQLFEKHDGTLIEAIIRGVTDSGEIRLEIAGSAAVFANKEIQLKIT